MYVEGYKRVYAFVLRRGGDVGSRCKLGFVGYVRRRFEKMSAFISYSRPYVETKVDKKNSPIDTGVEPEASQL